MIEQRIIYPIGHLESVSGREPTEAERAKFDTLNQARMEYSFRQAEEVQAARSAKPAGMSRAEYRRQSRSGEH